MLICFIKKKKSVSLLTTNERITPQKGAGSIFTAALQRYARAQQGGSLHEMTLSLRGVCISFQPGQSATNPNQKVYDEDVKL